MEAANDEVVGSEEINQISEQKEAPAQMFKLDGATSIDVLSEGYVFDDEAEFKGGDMIEVITPGFVPGDTSFGLWIKVRYEVNGEERIGPLYKLMILPNRRPTPKVKKK